MYELFVTIWLGGWIVYQFIWGNPMLAAAVIVLYYLFHILGRILRAIEKTSTKETTNEI